MKSFYSIIRFVNNPLSKENLAIGLIMISNDKIFHKFSVEKIQLVNKINPLNFKLLEYTIDKVSNFIKSELENEVSLFSDDSKVNLEYLKRLSIYNNGFLQFDSPSVINIDFDEVKFNDFFHKYIDLVIKPVEKKVIDNSFARVIKNVFREPLKDIINIDYKVKKAEIPNLFFDYKLDGIGYNGIIYSVKSIDLNSERPIDQIRKDISELESLNPRIDLFGKSKGFEPQYNKHYLVIDKYKGKKASYHELYEILSNQNSDHYKYHLINSEELKDVTSDIKNANANKFTDLINISN
ncbi:MAG: hypothetical protein LCH35_07465 [Bacteroidetes bacterium]|uniref:hypothetical protein n=1 Tax=Flavobacterium sp. TaxID=239 RepID=UPI002FD944B3|nr:hypothetical protein [Bacteroidota bacterium]